MAGIVPSVIPLIFSVDHNCSLVSWNCRSQQRRRFECDQTAHSLFWPQWDEKVRAAGMLLMLCFPWKCIFSQTSPSYSRSYHLPLSGVTAHPPWQAQTPSLRGCDKPEWFSLRLQQIPHTGLWFQQEMGMLGHFLPSWVKGSKLMCWKSMTTSLCPLDKGNQVLRLHWKSKQLGWPSRERHLLRAVGVPSPHKYRLGSSICLNIHDSQNLHLSRFLAEENILRPPQES